MTDDPTLDHFQRALLELLASADDLNEIRERLASDAAFTPFAEYVAGFEPRMLEIAAALVKRWGRRSE